MSFFIFLLAFVVGFAGTGIGYTQIKIELDKKEIIVYEGEVFEGEITHTHNYVAKNTIQPTENQRGYTTYECVCKQGSYNDDFTYLVSFYSTTNNAEINMADLPTISSKVYTEGELFSGVVNTSGYKAVEYYNIADNQKITIGTQITACIKIGIVWDIKTEEDTDVSFHFLELGNKYTGDCTYIKAGDVDILIDAGSKVSSIPTITAYLDNYVTDNTLEYVIVTHAHEDHYAGFAGSSTKDSLFDIYTVEIIIDFAKTNQTTGVMYNNYLAERDAEVANGAKHYTALDCVNKENGATDVWQITQDFTMTILNQKYYTEKASSENDYSVCTLFTHNNRNFLFTGDLEEEGEESLAHLNDLPHCDLYKAGHHGSKTSSHNVLLNEITPSVVCVCCCAGNYEYTKENANNFPTQDFIDRIAPHTDRVYVTTLGLPEYSVEDAKYKNTDYTSMNGNIVVMSSTEFTVNCSNNNLKLKETQWFKDNRTLPSAWAS